MFSRALIHVCTCQLNIARLVLSATDAAKWLRNFVLSVQMLMFSLMLFFSSALARVVSSAIKKTKVFTGICESCGVLDES